MDKCLLHTGDRSFLYRNWGWPLLIALICLISWERGRGRGERSIFADIYERRNYHVQIKHFSNDYHKSPSCPHFHPYRHTSWRYNTDSSLATRICLRVELVNSRKILLNKSKWIRILIAVTLTFNFFWTIKRYCSYKILF